MSENQYNAPAMEVVEFGKEDAVCTLSGFTVIDSKTGETIDHGPILPWTGSSDEWQPFTTRQLSIALTSLARLNGRTPGVLGVRPFFEYGIYKPLSHRAKITSQETPL